MRADGRWRTGQQKVPSVCCKWKERRRCAGLPSSWTQRFSVEFSRFSSLRDVLTAQLVKPHWEEIPLRSAQWMCLAASANDRLLLSNDAHQEAAVIHLPVDWQAQPRSYTLPHSRSHGTVGNGWTASHGRQAKHPRQGHSVL